MKKLALALVAISAAIFGTGLVVDAYPPTLGVILPSPATVAPGGIVTVIGSCQPGEGVTVTLGTRTGSGVCGAAGTGPTGSQPSAGGYSITVAAPTTVGTANGTAVGDVTGVLGNFSVVVAIVEPPVTQGGSTDPAGTLPSTGSDGTSTALIIGVGSLLVGLGLFVTARARRNQHQGAGSIA
jgi:LPXTG-motif cell wall-anchored protein